MDNFDLRKYLVENKATTNSRMLNEEEGNPSPEEAAKMATKIAPELEKNPKIQKVADAIANDPKAKAELMKLVGMNESANTNMIQNLALKFAEKASETSMNEGTGYGAPFWSGLVGGSILATKLAAMGDVITPHMEMMGHSPSHIGAAMVGAIAGAIVACVGKAVYDKSKGIDEGSETMNEAEPTFTLNYNTDPDDLKYVESMLSKKGIPAKVSKGTFDDEVEITVDKKHLKKAKQALEDEGFDV